MNQKYKSFWKSLSQQRLPLDASPQLMKKLHLVACFFISREIPKQNCADEAFSWSLLQNRGIPKSIYRILFRKVVSQRGIH
mmetsp:Transcript_33870/g.70411  ORF Transcript_33870/g.70411 Transcript_33870/m.70411 type:complete len:81 (-) Transcript_33870:29-271(-)